MTLPLMLIVAALVIYPAFYSLHLATLTKSMEHFVGLGNFEFLFKRDTSGWWCGSRACSPVSAVVFKALIGFCVAHFVHNVPVEGGQRKWRGMLLVPVGDPAAMSTLACCGCSILPTAPSTGSSRDRAAGGAAGWATRTGRASPSSWSNVWFGAPFFMIMYLAALKSVPEQLYEAAAIDGANWWQKLWYVTLPMMRNIIAITVLFSLIVTFANFDIVRVLTAGGRSTRRTCSRPGRSSSASRQRHPARRRGVALHVPDPGDRRHLHPARRHRRGEQRLMAAPQPRSRAARDARQHQARPRRADPGRTSSCASSSSSS
jgi:multiple sugar transport system permease protein